jgi:hypothetical protein
VEVYNVVHVLIPPTDPNSLVGGRTHKEVDEKRPDGGASSCGFESTQVLEGNVFRKPAL